MDRSTMTACSEAQGVPLSKVALAIVPATQSPRSPTDGWMNDGTLPGPTA